MTWVEALLPTDSEPVGKLAQSTLPLPVWATVYQISRVLGGLLPWILERGAVLERCLVTADTAICSACPPLPVLFTFLFTMSTSPFPFGPGV